jgi:hypothetical protein
MTDSILICYPVAITPSVLVQFDSLYHSHRGFSPVGDERKMFLNRFNGLLRTTETVETVK